MTEPYKHTKFGGLMQNTQETTSLFNITPIFSNKGFYTLTEWFATIKSCDKAVYTLWMVAFRETNFRWEVPIPYSFPRLEKVGRHLLPSMGHQTQDHDLGWMLCAECTLEFNKVQCLKKAFGHLLNFPWNAIVNKSRKFWILWQQNASYCCEYDIVLIFTT